MSENEANLLSKARSGDVHAFNQLVLIHQETAYNIALRLLMGDTAQAADITQDAFIVAFQSLQKLSHDNFRAWVLRIIHNKCIDQLRTQKRHKPSSLDEVVEENESAYFLQDTQIDLPEATMIKAELMTAVQACLQNLPEEQRTIIMMCDIDGHDYATIAEAIDLSLGTVKSRMSRPGKNLQLCLQGVAELLPNRYRL